MFWTSMLERFCQTLRLISLVILLILMPAVFLPNTKELSNVSRLNPNAMIFSPKHNINFTLDSNATVFKPDLKPQIEYKSKLI